MQAATARLACRTSASPSLGDFSSAPRTPRSPVQASSVPCSTPSPRISRRRWTARAAVADVAPPPTPRTPQQQQPAVDAWQDGAAPAEQQQEQSRPLYDCVDAATQSLAVNLTLEEYRAAAASLLASSSSSQQPQQPPSPGGGGSGGAALLTHLTLSSADLDSMGLCSHCRYPCYLSGMPACEAAHYLQLWDGDAQLKPRGFDAAASLRLRGVADIAAVSSGGRANGRWKPDNQDAFLVAPTASASSLDASSDGEGGGEAAAAAAAAAIGVFDGHGRLGGEAARTVRAAMAQRLAALSAGEAAAAAAGGLPAAAALLDSCFTAAEGALAASGRDFSKSGCTAVLALLDRDSVSVAWAGDSRAVLGVYDASGSLLGSVAASASSLSSGDADTFAPPPPGSPAASLASSDGSLGSLGAAAGAGSGSSNNIVPLCAAVPLTEDHKPDKPGERQRIAAAGGRVARLATDRFGNPAGPYRVFVPNCWSPGLALSRAFGDTLASSVGVTSKPEVTVLPLPPSPPPSPASPPPGAGASGAFALSNASAASCCALEGGAEAPGPGSSERHVLIVASDGLWEWVSNTTAVAIASSAGNAEDAAHALVEAAQKQWAMRYRGRNCDDITVVVAFLDR